MIVQLTADDNTIAIEHRPFRHHGFNFNVFHNRSSFGTTVKNDKPTYFLQHIDYEDKDQTLLILFVNSLEYPNDQFSNFIDDYLRALRRLTNELLYPKRNICIFTPMIKGNDETMHLDQIYQIHRFKNELSRMKLQYFDTYSNLPLPLKQINEFI